MSQKTFDVSAKQREILQFKHTRKIQLRQEYLKETLNPAMQTMPVCIDDFLTLLIYDFDNYLYIMQRDTVHSKSCLIAPLSFLRNH